MKRQLSNSSPATQENRHYHRCAHLADSAVAMSVFLMAAVVVMVCLAQAAYSQEEPDKTFTSELEVTAVRLTVVATDDDGKPVTDLGADEIRIFEEEIPVRILSFEPAAQRTEPSTEPVEHLETGDLEAAQPLPARADESSWRVVTYANTELSTRFELPQMLKAVAAEAPQLTSLGTVDVVVASPTPELVASGIQEPDELQKALLETAASYTGQGTLSALRSNFLRTMTPASTGPAGGRRREVGPTMFHLRTRTAVGEEIRKVQTEIGHLVNWLQTQPPADHGLLLLAMGGFDVDPVAFYLSALAQQSVDSAASLRAEFASLNLVADLQRLIDVAVAHGWMVVPLNSARLDAFIYGADAAGQEKWQQFVSPAANSIFAQGFEIATPQPMQSMELLAKISGGEVVRKPNLLPEALGRITGAYVVGYQATRANDGRKRAVQAQCSRPGVHLRTQQQVSAGTTRGVAEARGLRLLAGEPVDSGGLEVKAEVVDLERAGRKRRQGELQVTATVADLFEVVAQAGGGRMRVSVVVHPEGSIPFVSHAEAPLVPSSTVAVWSHRAPIEVPSDLEQIAVVVEELVTGVWDAQIITLE